MGAENENEDDKEGGGATFHSVWRLGTQRSAKLRRRAKQR
jgi:hypothetical protein